MDTAAASLQPDNRAYMREYMKKRYQKNPQREKSMRAAYRYKAKHEGCDEAFSRYKDQLATVMRAKTLLTSLREQSPAIYALFLLEITQEGIPET